MLPAVGQGALGIETRADDAETSALVAALDDADTRACVTAERALLHELAGRLPGSPRRVGAPGERRIASRSVRFFSGRHGIRRGASTAAPSPIRAGAGKRLGQILIEAGADRILRLAGRSVGHA